MEDRETARMRKYGESKTTRIMMATVPHVTSGLGLRKLLADVFLLTRVYMALLTRDDRNKAPEVVPSVRELLGSDDSCSNWTKNSSSSATYETQAPSTIATKFLGTIYAYDQTVHAHPLV